MKNLTNSPHSFSYQLDFVKLGNDDPSGHLWKQQRIGLEHMLSSAVVCSVASSERCQDRDGDDIHVAVINTIGKSNSRTFIFT